MAYCQPQREAVRARFTAVGKAGGRLLFKVPSRFMTQNPKNPPQDLVPVARIGDAYGVQGMIKVIPFAAQESVLLDVKQWWLMRSDAQARALEPMRNANLVRSRTQGANIVARLGDIADRDQAQALKGTTIYISRADFPQANEDEFYWIDLVGCLVYSRLEEPAALIGEVTEVSDNGAHGVLHIKRQALDEQGIPQDQLNAKGKVLETLIPFVKQTVPIVDIAAKRIEADWPVDF